MGLSSAQLDALIESARAALQTALDTPKTSYMMGGKAVNHFEYINSLRQQLENLVAMQAAMPSESIRAFDSDITDTGEDNTQEEGDE